MEILDAGALAAAVRTRAPDAPLDRVAAAIEVGEVLASGGDDLIGRFVAEAREAGCSWTEIGERMGVSKQAARQRFAQQAATPAAAGLRLQGGLKPQDQLMTCLEAAGREAAADGAGEVGTHHLLIGVFEEGVAAAILEKLGVRADAVRAAARELFPGTGQPGEVAPPEPAEARAAMWGPSTCSGRWPWMRARGLAGSWPAAESASRRSRRNSRATSVPAGSGAAGAGRRRPGRARSAANQAAAGCGWSPGRACTSAPSVSGCATRSSPRPRPIPRAGTAPEHRAALAPSPAWGSRPGRPSRAEGPESLGSSGP